MRFNVKQTIFALVAAVVLLGSSAAFAGPQAASSTRNPATPAETKLSEQVYRQLMDLPFFTVFDNLQYRVDGTEVTLSGQTANSRLQSDARKYVAKIPSVTKVKDNVELLPVSRFDDHIRYAEFQAIYSEPTLQKYAEGAYPSIHIIVKNSHVTLVGTVDFDADKQIAGTRAMQVRHVLSVDNQLKVEANP